MQKQRSKQLKNLGVSLTNTNIVGEMVHRIKFKQKNKVEIFKLVCIFLAVFLACFIFYCYKLHALAVEGNEIFEQRCLVVNPLLIQTKKTHLSLGAAIDGKTNPTTEEFTSELESLPKYADDYLVAEKSWLDKQEKYINRWDFKLIEPRYIKIAAKYQLAIYQGYYDYYTVVNNVFGRHLVQGEDLIPTLDKYWNNTQTNIDLYNQAIDKGMSIKDWRKIFGRVPVPAGCNDSNLIIPDTFETPEPASTPASVANPETAG